MKPLDQLFDDHMREVFEGRQEEFTQQLTNRLRKLWLLALETRTGDSETATEEEVSRTEVYGRTYPGKAPDTPPGWEPPKSRDCKRPFCRGCGGTGVGDYPYACHGCGGTGNG